MILDTVIYDFVKNKPFTCLNAVYLTLLFANVKHPLKILDIKKAIRCTLLALDLLEEVWAVFGVFSLAGASFVGVVSMIHTT